MNITNPLFWVFFQFRNQMFVINDNSLKNENQKVNDVYVFFFPTHDDSGLK